MQAIVQGGCISADSHIVEAPNCYTDYIEPKFRDRAPHMEVDERGGDVFVIPGMEGVTIPLGLVAGAGVSSEDLVARRDGAKFVELHRSGAEARFRAADQERDGIAAEILYASIGMVICNHEDFEYKSACMQAYNRWLAEYCSEAPTRLYGLAQTAVSSVEEAIADVRRAKEMGFVGMMMPGDPQIEDYDKPYYDPLWECAADLQMPVCFHILTSKSSSTQVIFGKVRGSRINGFMNIIRGVQDIVGLFVLGGVFDRHPKLKLVIAEGDAGWLPHYSYRMDHAYERHGYWLEGRGLKKAPSEYINENVYFTFQDDWVAFKNVSEMNPRRLLWANDFPHTDSTWPLSQELLAEHSACISDEERQWIVRDNTKELFNLSC